MRGGISSSKLLSPIKQSKMKKTKPQLILLCLDYSVREAASDFRRSGEFPSWLTTFEAGRKCPRGSVGRGVTMMPQ